VGEGEMGRMGNGESGRRGIYRFLNLRFEI